MNKRFSILERIKSFSFALQGIRTFFVTQHNAWLHLLCSVLAILLGLYVHLDNHEWCWIVIAIALVFVSEMLNTAIEFLSDVVSPNRHPEIKKVKDVSAAAVLFAAIAALLIGLMIFLPRIYTLLES